MTRGIFHGMPLECSGDVTSMLFFFADVRLEKDFCAKYDWSFDRSRIGNMNRMQRRKIDKIPDATKVKVTRVFYCTVREKLSCFNINYKSNLHGWFI